MSETTLAPNSPVEILGVQVEPFAQAATAAGNIALGFGKQVPHDPGDMLRYAASAFPLVKEIRDGHDPDSATVRSYLDTTAAYRDSLPGPDAWPPVLKPMGLVLQEMTAPGAEETLPARIRERLTAPETKAAARGALEHLDFLAQFPSPQDKIRSEISTVVDRSAGVDSDASVGPRKASKGLESVLEELQTGEAHDLPLLQAATAGYLAVMRSKQPTGEEPADLSIPSRSKLAAIMPTLVPAVREGLRLSTGDTSAPLAGPTVSKGVLGRLATKVAKDETSAVRDHVPTLVDGIVRALPTDQAHITRIRQEVTDFFRLDEAS